MASNYFKLNVCCIILKCHYIIFNIDLTISHWGSCQVKTYHSSLTLQSHARQLNILTNSSWQGLSFNTWRFSRFIADWGKIWTMMQSHAGFRLIDFWCFNAIFNNISAISWRPVLVLAEAGVYGENHQPWASNW